jgi:hypothetical protein
VTVALIKKGADGLAVPEVSNFSDETNGILAPKRDWLAGHVRLELGNPHANHVFEIP